LVVIFVLDNFFCILLVVRCRLKFAISRQPRGFFVDFLGDPHFLGKLSLRGLIARETGTGVTLNVSFTMSP